MTTTAKLLRCPATHNPGVWPYVSRCVRDAAHADNHVDRHGIRWSERSEHGGDR